jgi:hypothetical protein
MGEVSQLVRYFLRVECRDEVGEAERGCRAVAQRDVVMPLGTNGYRYGGVDKGGMWEWAAMRRSGGTTGVVGRCSAREADESDDPVGDVDCAAREPSVVCLQL